MREFINRNYIKIFTRSLTAVIVTVFFLANLCSNSFSNNFAAGEEGSAQIVLQGSSPLTIPNETGKPHLKIKAKFLEDTHSENFSSKTISKHLSYHLIKPQFIIIAIQSLLILQYSTDT